NRSIEWQVDEGRARGSPRSVQRRVAREGGGADRYACIPEGDASGGSDIHDQGGVRGGGTDRAIPNEQGVRNGDVDRRSQTVAVGTHRDVSPEVDQRVVIDVRRDGVRRHVRAGREPRQAHARRPGHWSEVWRGGDAGREVPGRGLSRAIRSTAIDL